MHNLGARKGEREWNVGLGLVDRNRFDQYEALVEYEWAPANRLGLEVEVPLTFYPANGTNTPSNRIEGLKTVAEPADHDRDQMLHVAIPLQPAE